MQCSLQLYKPTSCRMKIRFLLLSQAPGFSSIASHEAILLYSEGGRAGDTYTNTQSRPHSVAVRLHWCEKGCEWKWGVFGILSRWFIRSQRGGKKKRRNMKIGTCGVGGGMSGFPLSLTSELLSMCRQMEIQHLTGVCRDHLSLTLPSTSMNATCILRCTCMHTRTQSSSVGKQLLHTFIGNYCWRSHISGGAEFQERKKKARFLCNPSLDLAGAQESCSSQAGEKLGHSLNGCHSASHSWTYTQSQCPPLAPKGDAGETPFEKAERWQKTIKHHNGKTGKKRRDFYGFTTFTFLYVKNSFHWNVPTLYRMSHQLIKFFKLNLCLLFFFIHVFF